ncbi:MAG: transposase [Saprospiraceae bacterium]|nr:transposase [Saprospiraceae bacterium]
MRKSLLPHYYAGHNCFFITFRLADSLPQKVVSDYKNKMKSEIDLITESNPFQKEQLEERIKMKYFRRYEHQLHVKPYGECYLSNIEIAQILYDKILSYHGLFYDLKCLSIMPNHVHLLFTTMDLNSHPPVDKWLQLIKGGSAYLINSRLNRKGKFWAKESFDRYIRNEKHYHNTFYYIINNPVTAGLPKKYLVLPYIYRCDK